MVGLMLYVFGIVADTDRYDAAHMPLSDTTNLAAAVAGTGLFDHVRAMVSTTGPVFLIAMLGRNIFWADGSYTNLLGKTKKGTPAACPDDIREQALANLEAARAAGLAPRPE